MTSARVVEEDLDDLFAEYATVYESHWVAFDDAVEVLDDLVAAGYVLEMLTNGQRAQQVASWPASVCSTGSGSWEPPARCQPGKQIPVRSPSYASDR